MRGERAAGVGEAAEAAGLIPEDFDWEELVREYPIPALLVAGVGGFILGRNRGPMVLAALSTFAASLVSQQVNELVGVELIEPEES